MTAVLFDFNGVLVDDEELHFEAFRAVLSRRGIELDRDRYCAELLGFDDAGLLAAVLPALSRDQIARSIEEKAAEYSARSESGLKLFAGAAALVGALRARGIPMGVVSGALRREVTGTLERFGLAASFRFVVAAEDVSRCKPDPEGYLAGLARLREAGLVRDPHECVVIEDSPPGVAAARAAGLRVIGVGHTVPPEALGAADLVVPSLVALDAGVVLALS